MTRLITGTYLAQTKAPSHQENPANAESTKNLNNGTRFNPDFRFSVMRDGAEKNMSTLAGPGYVYNILRFELSAIAQE